MIKDPKNIVISRTDSIGDVILTLPLAGILKAKFPNTKIIFLGNTYTKPIINCCEHVDEIWEWAELEKLTEKERLEWLREKDIEVFIHVFPNKEIAKLVKQAKIPNRIGTSHRLFHLNTCNHRPSFTRKKSDLHESQLNTKLLKPLGISNDFSLEELFDFAAFNNIPELPIKFSSLIDSKKKNIIFHPKSQGSALEWGVENFIELAKSLESNNANIFFTGTEKEAAFFRELLPKSENIIDLSGKMSLDELIAFISKTDLLIAASTGPLHIAGITGIRTIGLFSPRKPIHSGRWRPLGYKGVVVDSKNISEDTQRLDIEVRDIEKEV